MTLEIETFGSAYEGGDEEWEKHDSSVWISVGQRGCKSMILITGDGLECKNIKHRREKYGKAGQKCGVIAIHGKRYDRQSDGDEGCHNSC